ncbi:MAG: tetratricopeptide repeat protein, partial [Acidobacteriota bacterium]|nr:tetratricopeptide repeat protein [Acidobacteriota bacterium]
PLKAMRHLGWKLVVAPKMEIYDLSIDPGETENRILAPKNPARRLAAAVRGAEAQPPRGSGATADPETVARLRALGYTGGGPSHREPPEGLPDPKDRLETWNLLGEAEDLLQREQPAEALQRFDQALEQDPGNPFALARSGFALLQLERAEDAVKRLQEAARKAPDQPEIRLTLAHALGKAGRHEDAAHQWQELVALQPERVTAWSRLGTALGLAGRSEDAVSAFQRAVELAPESPTIELRLAFAQFAAGQRDEAVKNFLAVARRTGAEDFPHPSALGLLLVDRQRSSEALPWLRRGRPDEGDYGRGQLALAQLELSAGDTPAARQALHRALEAQPGLRDEITEASPLAPLLP